MDQAKRTVSLVITVRNDAAGLKRLLKAISLQVRQPNEIIVVVAKSNDDTMSVAQSWKMPGVKLVVIDEPGSNRSQGRNIGVKHARGEIIVFTDAGCVPQKQWLEELLKPFSSQRVRLVSGYTVGEWKSDFEQAQIPFVLVPLNKTELAPLPATRNMAIKRQTFLEMGGFRENLNYAEDFEFSRRLRDGGLLSAFAAEAIVSWRPRETWWEFFLMIMRLTAGDLSAGIVRTGLLSVWLRYFVFASVAVVRPTLAVLLFSVYLMLKAKSFHFTKWKVILWSIVLQITCDAAVLSGTIVGSLHWVLARLGREVENNNNAS